MEVTVSVADHFDFINIIVNIIIIFMSSIIFPVSLHCTYPIKPEERPKENTRKHDVNILSLGGDFIKHMDLIHILVSG